MKNKFGYIVALTNGAYLPGVVALKKSLRRVKSNYNLFILIPDDSSDSLLELLNRNAVLDDFCSVIIKPNIIAANDKNHFWDFTFFKLQAVSLVEFDKLILIDADMLVNRNIDHLFKCDSFSAVVAGKATHNEYNNLNSGLLVIEPNIGLFNTLVKSIPDVITKRNQQKLFAGDQDVFIEYKKDWQREERLHLSEVYNCFFLDMYRVAKANDCKCKDLYIIHFIGKEKPWMKRKVFKYYFWLLRNRRFSQLKFFHRYRRLARVK